MWMHVSFSMTYSRAQPQVKTLTTLELKQDSIVTENKQLADLLNAYVIETNHVLICENLLFFSSLQIFVFLTFLIKDI